MGKESHNYLEKRNWDNKNFVHPWEGMESIGNNERMFAESAKGIYVVNENGQRLIDGPAGMWCVQLGYGNSEIAEAMAKQTRELAYFSPFNNTNSSAVHLAKEIAKRTPGDLNHVLFTTGGSTAVDSALRFVHFRNNVLGKPEKKIIISREKAYHGSTYLAASVSGKERDKGWMDQAQELSHFLPHVNPALRSEDLSIEDFLNEKIADFEKAILTIGAHKIAAFIAEPIQASGGVIVAPEGYHKRCLDLCRKYDILYISDEVVTGFGRLGQWFSSEEVFGIVPDIIICAKGMTSGYSPMGACIISDQLIADVSGDKSKNAIFSNGFTYSGHPVSAMAALKNIEIFERENILEHVREVTPLFQQRLHQLKEFPLVIDTRGMGLMGCVECSIDSASDNALALDYKIGERIDFHCQKLGLIVRPIINMCVFSPPLIISNNQINKMFDILEKGILLATEDVIKEGLVTI